MSGQWWRVVGILWILVIYVTMVYGPIAAMLVELFPTRIRYTSMSLPYHIGNGWFGGLLPTTAFAIVASTGNMYNGLWYPIIVAAMSLRHRHAVHQRNQGRRHLPSRLTARRAQLRGRRFLEPPAFFHRRCPACEPGQWLPEAVRRARLASGEQGAMPVAQQVLLDLAHRVARQLGGDEDRSSAP